MEMNRDGFIVELLRRGWRKDTFRDDFFNDCWDEQLGGICWLRIVHQHLQGSPVIELFYSLGLDKFKQRNSVFSYEDALRRINDMGFREHIKRAVLREQYRITTHE